MNSPGWQVPNMLLKQRNNSRKNEETEPKRKQSPAVDVTGDGSKVQCCKEQYRIGTWNVRSMSQGKLKVVKWEKAGVNINILGISELKWTGWANLTQMTIISATVGKNPLEEIEQPSQSTKESEMLQLGTISKNDRIISVHFQGKTLNIMIIQVYALTSNAEEAEVEQFFEDLQDLQLTP